MPDARDVPLWDGASASLAGWSAIASAGSSARLAVEPAAGGRALRLDFALADRTAFAIARHELAPALALPAHYALRLVLRGEGPANDFQVKLVEPGGANVWWWRLPHFELPRARCELVLRHAKLAFAWGPAGGGEPGRVAALELALQAGQPGAGSLWLESLRLEPRERTPAAARPVAALASSAQPGHAAACALEPDEATSWRPAADDATPWLALDLGQRCELGGLVVEWEGEAAASRLLGSEDGESWLPLAESVGGGPRTWLRAEADARWLRLVPAPAGCAGVRRVSLVPIELAVAPIRHAEALARAAPRGTFPRHLLGEALVWALVGGDGDSCTALLSEDGALEIAAEAWSLEPFLFVDGSLLSWADVERAAELAPGSLPLPSVSWRARGLRLAIGAARVGPPGASALVACYEVTNESEAARRVRLFLALRPFQVTPAWQGLNLTGGFAPLALLTRRGDRLRVGAALAAGAGAREEGLRELACVTRPDGFGASGGLDLVTRHLVAGRTPEAERVLDPLGLAEGALVYDLALEPGGRECIAVALAHSGAAPARPVVPSGLSAGPSGLSAGPSGLSALPALPALPSGLSRAAAAAWAEARFAEAAAHWRARLARIPIELPRAAADFEESLRASLAWMLVSREGPRLQPGTRAYRRSWIRDGVLMAGALLEMGFADEPRAFLRWYAPYQQADGRVPCAVDRRGVDPAVEHDSHGELVWGIVETFRHTRDRAFLAELWPHVARAVEAIDALRAERSGSAHRGRASFGLLPESISHEGYSSRPVHAYWDDFFALRALGDAADAAGWLGHAEQAVRFAASRDALRDALAASVPRAMAEHGIDFVPGSVELGDLDPSGTAIAFDPCGLEALLPAAALARTFARGWQELEARWSGGTRQAAATPYELRSAVALLRLGHPERALELLARWIAEQRPPAWRQWPEVCWSDPRAPRFLGDLPHGWIAATFVRALRRLFADERPDGSLVLADGVPEAWLEEDGVRVRELSTHFGPLSYALSRAGEDGARVVFGAPIERPPGGVILCSPLRRPLRAVRCDGLPHPDFEARRVRLRELPAELELLT